MNLLKISKNNNQNSVLYLFLIEFLVILSIKIAASEKIGSNLCSEPKDFLKCFEHNLNRKKRHTDEVEDDKSFSDYLLSGASALLQKHGEKPDFPVTEFLDQVFGKRLFNVTTNYIVPCFQVMLPLGDETGTTFHLAFQVKLDRKYKHAMLFTTKN